MNTGADIVDEASGLPGGSGFGGMLAGFSMWGVLASLLFSGVGFFYFKRGKDNGDMLMLGCGIALLGYSYFVSDILYVILIGSALSALPWALRGL